MTKDSLINPLIILKSEFQSKGKSTGDFSIQLKRLQELKQEDVLKEKSYHGYGRATEISAGVVDWLSKEKVGILMSWGVFQVLF